MPQEFKDGLNTIRLCAQFSPQLPTEAINNNYAFSVIMKMVYYNEIGKYQIRRVTGIRSP